MRNRRICRIVVALAVLACAAPSGWAQQRRPDPQLVAKRNALEQELESVAIIER